MCFTGARVSPWPFWSKCAFQEQYVSELESKSMMQVSSSSKVNYNPELKRCGVYKELHQNRLIGPLPRCFLISWTYFSLFPSPSTRLVIHLFFYRCEAGRGIEVQWKCQHRGEWSRPPLPSPSAPRIDPPHVLWALPCSPPLPPPLSAPAQAEVQTTKFPNF